MPVETDPNPSKEQIEVLAYIICHVMVHGFQPSQSEIAEHFGITKGAINKRLQNLARRGYVEYSGGRFERAIIIPFLKFNAEPTSERKPPHGRLKEVLAKRVKEIASVIALANVTPTELENE